MSSSSAYDHHVNSAIRTFPGAAGHQYSHRENGVKQHQTWVCGKCRRDNHQGREACNNCGSKRFDSVAPHTEFSGAFQQTKHPAENHPADWTCKSCTYLNSEFHNNCLKCKAPKPYQNQRNVNYEVGRQPEYVHHWTCRQCNVLNNGNRSYCDNCRRPPEQWGCKSCLFVNAGNRHFCSKCRRDRDHERSVASSTINTVNNKPPQHWPRTQTMNGTMSLADIGGSRNLSSSSLAANDMDASLNQFMATKGASPDKGWLCSCGFQNCDRKRCANCQGFRFNAVAHSVNHVGTVPIHQKSPAKTYEPMNATYGSGSPVRIPQYAQSAR